MSSKRKSGIDQSRHPTVLAVLTLAFVVASSWHVTHAQNDKVSAGQRSWKSSGCADCHGPFADGDREDDDFPVGANLRTTRLETAALKMTIGCGRPSMGMPAFEEGAYTTYSCYGRPLGSVPNNLQPTAQTLTGNDIDAVIAYLQARIIGRGRITREECLAYYDNQPDPCEDYK